MFSWPVYLHGLMAMLAFGFAGWLVSVAKRNVTLVDSMWSLFFLLAACVYALSVAGSLAELAPRAMMVLSLVTLWSLRLATYLTWRNWSPHEDHRYQAIRKNNEPHFWLKSIYIVFGLQAMLAWIISLPLLGAINSMQSLTWLDYVGAALWLLGFVWESTGDWQLASFKAKPENKGKVMDKGLWRYSRHPNYFGEFCIWWGYFLIALGAGAWWSLLAPALMTLLLLKVSGVALLEKDIGDRRPGYKDYVARTNAFFPGKPKAS
ncbi:MAG TPA: DUF1295 domain-containing protein [Methylophilaceae bacterium]|nr:DUF1295 domain-containing protein [Methylophilaceae bacterium]